MPMKSCPACREGCGPRTLVCKCGHEFQIGKKEQHVSFPAQAVAMPVASVVGVTPHGVLLTPAGKCPPVKTGIRDWIAERLAERPCSIGALKQWIGRGYGYHSPEYSELIAVLPSGVAAP